jgi:hypothetical protein
MENLSLSDKQISYLLLSDIDLLFDVRQQLGPDYASQVFGAGNNSGDLRRRVVIRYLRGIGVYDLAHWFEQRHKLFTIRHDLLSFINEDGSLAIPSGSLSPLWDLVPYWMVCPDFSVH